jgi:hypothetical protein
MPERKNLPVAKDANRILRDRSLTKKEKIKKLFYHFREKFPNDSQEELFQLALDYYEYKLGKINPDKFHFK